MAGGGVAGGGGNHRACSSKTVKNAAKSDPSVTRDIWYIHGVT